MKDLKLVTFKQFITEAPYLYNSRLELEKLSSLSKKSIEARFSYLGKVKNQSFDVYENNDNGSILAGVMVDDEFYPIISITNDERSLYVKSMQLADKRKHVRMVRTNQKFESQRVALDTYEFIAQEFNLVSDRIQYLGAKALWQSLARQGRVNVYVFDEDKKDYIRLDNEKPVKYNGKNITDELIWGKKEEHQNKLLVASVREFK